MRLVVPGGRSSRAVQINGAEDIAHYNVTVNNQKFERLREGTAVESDPIPAGSRVHVTIEAIGSIRDPQYPDPLVENKRVAFFETTEIMKSGGINISVKMREYITEYCRIDFTCRVDSTIFNYHPSWKDYVYVEKGKPFTLPNYGLCKEQPPTGRALAPMNHDSWLQNLPTQGERLQAGASVIVNGDMGFVLIASSVDNFVSIGFSAGNNYLVQSENSDLWKTNDFVEKGTRYELPSYPNIYYEEANPHGSTFFIPTKHTGWTDQNQNFYPLGSSIIIGNEPVSFTLVASKGIALVGFVANATIDDTRLTEGIYKAPSDKPSVSGGLYFIWHNVPFTAPYGTMTDGSPVTAWEFTDGDGQRRTIVTGVDSATYDWALAEYPSLTLTPKSN